MKTIWYGASRWLGDVEYHLGNHIIFHVTRDRNHDLACNVSSMRKVSHVGFWAHLKPPRSLKNMSLGIERMAKIENIQSTPKTHHFLQKFFVLGTLLEAFLSGFLCHLPIPWRLSMLPPGVHPVLAERGWPYVYPC